MAQQLNGYMNNMQAVILAAGKSTRFYPYNQTLEHKSLFSLLGKPILEHTLLSLKRAGIAEIIIIVGEQESVIEKLFGNGERLGIHITYRYHEGAKGGGAALLEAKDILTGSFLLINAYHIDVDEFIPDLLKKNTGQNVVLLGQKVDTASESGFAQVAGDKVLSVIEKPKTISQESLKIVGMYLLPKEFLAILEKTPLSHYHLEEALDSFAKNNDVQIVQTNKKSITLKYVTDLFALKDYLLSKITTHISPNAIVSKTAQIIGAVIVEDGAEIMEQAVIKGPCFIGRNTKIGTMAILRSGVVVEENVVIGARLEAKNTIFAKNVTTHNGFIGDSIVGENTKIAGSIITANARLDRQPVSIFVKEEKVNTGIRHVGAIFGESDNIGVQVSTMPGVIVGNDVVVGPATTVMKNIPDNKKYFTKFAETVEENNG